MKIVSLFSRNSLTPLWTFTPSGAIWRLLLSESGEFVGEARDQEKKQVSFFALNGESGTPLWQNLALDEKWWVGIEEVSRGILLLHGFASPDLPGHQGIMAVDLLTGNTLWTNADLTFWFVHENSLIAHRSLFEKRLFYELNLNSGATLREFDQESESVLLQMRGEAIHNNQGALEFPDAVDINSFEPQTARAVKKELPLINIHGGIESLQTGDYLVLNYHVHSHKSSNDALRYDNHLKIIDLRNGNVAYSDLLSREVKAPVPDSFFVKANTVYYIKDQKTLTAVKLDQ